MRELIYVLANGTEVKTLKEAKASNQNYRVKAREINQGKATHSPIQQAMLKQFGYVSAKLKDKIVL